MALTTLRKRSEFLRVRGGGRWATPLFVLEGKSRTPQDLGAKRPSVQPSDPTTKPANTQLFAELQTPRFGFTVTKKLGNAVRRNRIRRRLKAALSDHLSGSPTDLRAEYDYVVIARDGAFDAPFSELLKTFGLAFAKVHKPPKRRGRKPSRQQ